MHYSISDIKPNINANHEYFIYVVIGTRLMGISTFSSPLRCSKRFHPKSSLRLARLENIYDNNRRDNA